MFKKLLLAIGLSFLSVPAFASCTNPLTILNSASATVNMSVSQNTADAGCMYNVTPNQGGAPLSATNGWYTNILQGNAAISATNGLYTNLLQGNAAIASGNPLFSQLTAGSAIVGKFGIDQTTPGTTNGVQVNNFPATQPVSVASGQIVDGGDATQGAKADSVCATATGTCSVTALLKFLNNAASGAIPAGTNTIGNTNGAPNVTPTDCSGTITAGGTAQNAIAAQTTLHGFTIMNIDTTEPLWISFTTTAAASGSGSYPLQAATATTFASPGSFTTPNGFGLNHALSVIAATTSHKFSCTWW